MVCSNAEMFMFNKNIIHLKRQKKEDITQPAYGFPIPQNASTTTNKNISARSDHFRRGTRGNPSVVCQD